MADGTEYKKLNPIEELRSLVSAGRLAWKLVPVRYRIGLGIASLIMAMISLGNVSVAMMLGSLVDRIRGMIEQDGGSTGLGAVGFVFIVIAIIYLVREALNVARRVIVEQICTRMNCNMQKRVIHHVMQFDIQEFSAEKVGALHSKIFRSVDGLIHFVRLMFLDCLPAVFTGTMAILAAIYKHPLLGFIMTGVIPISCWITIKQLNSQKKVRLELMRDCEAIDGTFIEQLSGLEYIRVANTLGMEADRLGSAMEKRRRREIAHHTQMAFYGCAKALNEGAFHIIVLIASTYLALHQSISVGDVLTFSVLFMNVMAPLNEVHRVVDQGHESSLRMADLMHLMQTPVDASFHTKPTSNNVRTFSKPPRIELQNVEVRYRTQKHGSPVALKNLTQRIESGETIGVAGFSGSGKSTWIKVLLRLLHPHSGQIMIDGNDLREYGRDDLAKLFGYVGQTPFIFSGTIHENIAYGSQNATEEMIIHAAEQAHLHEEIMESLGGYQTRLAERGNNLSGGQRQRIAIARELLKKSPVLILDEATSALDNVNERKIQSALALKSHDRTTIILAHRISTLRDCDRIFVFDRGEIVESGSYTELMDRQGLFATLVLSAESDASGYVSH